jgi:hypothetical protein
VRGEQALVHIGMTQERRIQNNRLCTVSTGLIKTGGVDQNGGSGALRNLLGNDGARQVDGVAVLQQGLLSWPADTHRWPGGSLRRR